MAVTLAFGGWSGEVIAAAKPKLSKTSAAMYVGQSTKLKVKNTSAKVKYYDKLLGKSGYSTKKIGFTKY